MVTRQYGKLLLLLAMLFVAVAGWPQAVVLSGTVTDASTGRPVAGASVTWGHVSVVTNDDGFFTLKNDVAGEQAVVSHVGYKSQRISAPAQDQRIQLHPTTIQLQEVLVMADNAREIVMTAISKIPKNYSTRPELFSCFYRETTMKRQHYISVAEGVVDMYKTGYTHGTHRDAVAIRKGRRLLSPRKGDTLSVKVTGGPVVPLMLDLVKNTEFLLNKKELDNYELTMEMPTTIAERSHYVVSIKPRCKQPYALYYGQLYIDQETLAFTRAELTLDMSDRQKATAMMLVRKPAGVRFRPKELSCLIDYRYDEGVTRISYVRTTFRFNCDWKRRLFSTSFAAFCEMAVTGISGISGKSGKSGTSGKSGLSGISGRDSFDQRDAFFDKVDFFRDPAFWQDYNIIEPSERLDKAIGKLIKKYPTINDKQ